MITFLKEIFLVNHSHMIYNYELILEELTENGIELAENKIKLKYARGYHRYEKHIFGHIRIKPSIEIKRLFNFPIWISKKPVLGHVERILASKIGLPHARKNGVLLYWLPFKFNGDREGVEIITVRE